MTSEEAEQPRYPAEEEEPPGHHPDPDPADLDEETDPDAGPEPGSEPPGHHPDPDPEEL